MKIDDFKKLVTKERKVSFPKPYELVYQEFEAEGYHLKDESFFFKNASSVVEQLRINSWNFYKPLARDFTKNMLKSLVDENKIIHLTGVSAISWFIDAYPSEIDALVVSNTNSRRSRAGSEFEAIIELVIMGANIPLDSQGNVGKKFFEEKGLAKIIDLVSPHATAYELDKRRTILISAKTTLRERWQEVTDEMARTGVKELYLVTLDHSVSKDVIENLYENGIWLVTTRKNKLKNYNDTNRVIEFEELLYKLKEINEKWQASKDFSKVAKEKIIASYERQISKHVNAPFVVNYYKKQIELLEK